MLLCKLKLKVSSIQFFFCFNVYLQFIVEISILGLGATDTALNNSIVAITPPKPVAGPRPTSCTSYKTMGHTQNGFYLVQSGTSQIRTTYCDFSKAAGTGGNS